MDSLLDPILNHEQVTSVYGYWPSFHDAEVVSARLERDEGKPLTGAVLTVAIHLFRLEAAPDAPNRDNRLVTISFKGVQGLRLLDFNHQNALSGLLISRKRSELLNADLFAVQFKPGFGIDCSFECARIEVLSVDPFRPKWGAWAQD